MHFDSPAGPITVFTTRPDTLFGATFMVLAPEHPLVDALTTPEQADAVAAVPHAGGGRRRTSTARTTTARRPACSPARTPINPVNGEPIPVWIADYVLMGYGTGAIMAVPCGDQRDFEFARSSACRSRPSSSRPTWFDAGIDRRSTRRRGRRVRRRRAVRQQRPTTTLDLDGIDDSRRRRCASPTTGCEANGHGEATITYKLRDWLFSRQRYWGEPFPIVYDDDGNPHALPDAMLPVDAARDRQLLAAHVRPRRRVLQPREPARPARLSGSTSSSISATARSATAARPT